jgi:hypothetical protein
MFILDPDFFSSWIQGSKRTGSRIRIFPSLIQGLKRTGSRIRTFSIPDSGVKKALDPGSRSATLLIWNSFYEISNFIVHISNYPCGVHISDVPARGNVFGCLITRVLGYPLWVGVAHSSPYPIPPSCWPSLALIQYCLYNAVSCLRLLNME